VMLRPAMTDCSLLDWIYYDRKNLFNQHHPQLWERCTQNDEFQRRSWELWFLWK